MRYINNASKVRFTLSDNSSVDLEISTYSDNTASKFLCISVPDLNRLDDEQYLIADKYTDESFTLLKIFKPKNCTHVTLLNENLKEIYWIQITDDFIPTPCVIRLTDGVEMNFEQIIHQRWTGSHQDESDDLGYSNLITKKGVDLKYPNQKSSIINGNLVTIPMQLFNMGNLINDSEVLNV